MLLEWTAVLEVVGGAACGPAVCRPKKGPNLQRGWARVGVRAGAVAICILTCGPTVVVHMHLYPSIAPGSIAELCLFYLYWK